MKAGTKAILWLAAAAVAAASLIVFAPAYHGERVIYLVMEVAGVFLALSVAIVAFNCAVDGTEGLSPYISAAFLAAGIADLAHALFAMGIITLPQDTLDSFIPGTWTIGRTVLGAILLYGLVRTSRDPRHIPSTGLLALAAVLITAGAMAFFALVPLPAFIIGDVSSFFRPWEVPALVLYGACLWMIFKGGEGGKGIPLIPCLILGMAVQAVMSSSPLRFYPSPDTSHIMKDASYLAALLPLGVLALERARKSVQGASLRILSGAAVLLLALSLASMVTLAVVKSMFDETTEAREEGSYAGEVRRDILMLAYPLHDYLASGDLRARDEFETGFAGMTEELGSPIAARLEEEYDFEPNRYIEEIRLLADSVFAGAVLADQGERARLDHEVNELFMGELALRLDGVVRAEGEEIAMLQDTSLRWNSRLILGQVAILLALLPVLFVLGSAQARRQVRPLIELTRTALDVQGGSRGVRAGVTTGDEVGALAMAFNYMLDSMQESEERADLAIKGGDLGTWDWNVLTGEVVYNERLAEMLGYRLDEIKPDLQAWKKFVHPDDLPMAEERLNLHMEGRRPFYEAELRMRMKFGQWKWVLVRGMVVERDDEGWPRRVTGTHLDITENKAAGDALRRSEENLRDFLDSASDLIQSVSPDGRFTYVNRAWRETLGYSEAEVADLTTFDVVHPDQHDYCRGIFERFTRGEDISHIETDFISKDGRKVPVSGSINCRMVDGELVATRGIFHDCTERELRMDLRRLIEAANAPIFGIDVRGRVNEWNRTAERITGYTKEEVMGRDFVGEFISNDYKGPVGDVLGKALKGEEIADYEFPLYTKGGRRVLFLMNATARRDAAGGITGVFGVGQDITEAAEYREGLERKVEERTVELSKALEREKDLGELKTRFVSMASHEFRTPLTSILSSSDIIKRYAARMTDEERAERLDKIQSEVTHMTEMLEDVLVVGKAEAGRLEFNPRTLDLKKLCREFAEGAVLSAGESHDVEFSWAGECGDAVGDGKLLKNILSNLLSNAVKYSPDGGKVSFDVSCDGDTAVFRVKDEGIGIPEKDMERLFAPFHRGKNVGNIPGTGLGLSIIKNSVDLHGGTIEVDSEVGKGTAFLVTIPVGKKGG
ncbi:MAG: PAS domain S-box protein [Thermodesulfobacteriota bacterium]